ncbi:MAG: NUDIX hydrolase [Hyphomicrobiales bacterium]|nr:NUDIX hydrolase [Hyphomicrobiales bacterium]
MFERKPDPPGFRQSAALPYRRTKGGCEVLLITSRTNRRWIIPKGLIEPNMTAPQSAALEAFEEAGVRGKMCDACLGTYGVEKYGTQGTVEVYAMRVTEELDKWPEQADRQRQWLPIEQAITTAGDEGVAEILRGFAAGKKWKKKKNGG